MTVNYRELAHKPNNTLLLKLVHLELSVMMLLVKVVLSLLFPAPLPLFPAIVPGPSGGGWGAGSCARPRVAPRA